MPFLVEQLIEGKPFPLTTRQDEPVTKALSQMIEHDFSQLPVVEDDIPIGMVTYEGILRGVRNFKTNVDQLFVRDVIDSAPISNPEDDLFDLLELLKLKNAVLIQNAQGKLIGIVTSYDSTEYFRDRAEHLMRVEDIESTIKEIILLAYTSENEKLDEQSLSDSISKVAHRETAKGKDVGYDDLSLGQYISLLLYKHTWQVFDPIFQMTRDSIRNILEDIRDIRNDLAHFRSELSPDQIDQLRFCSDWITRKWEEFQKSKQDELVGQLFDEVRQPAQEEVMVRESGPTYQLDGVKAGMSSLVEALKSNDIIAEETLPRESKYAPLADWLQSQPGNIDQVQLSFEEIEEIISGNLPRSAYDHRAWWSNDSTGHPHARLWLEAGWRSSYVNMSERRVTFVRIRERQQAYINFFSKLLTELKEKTDLPLRDVAPGGSSWGGCYAIASGGSNVANFGFSFIRGSGFRVELYIDSGDKEKNKRAFDRIHENREDIESKLGAISWERIDDKRASRIAIYHDGSITDSDEQLEALRKWGIQTMIPFIETIEPLASKAFDEVLNE